MDSSTQNDDNGDKFSDVTDRDAPGSDVTDSDAAGSDVTDRDVPNSDVAKETKEDEFRGLQIKARETPGKKQLREREKGQAKPEY